MSCYPPSSTVCFFLMQRGFEIAVVPLFADVSLVKTSFYLRYAVSTVITEPTEPKHLYALFLEAGRLADQRQHHHYWKPWGCVCAKRTYISTTENKSHTEAHIPCVPGWIKIWKYHWLIFMNFPYTPTRAVPCFTKWSFGLGASSQSTSSAMFDQRVYLKRNFTERYTYLKRKTMKSYI